MNLYISLMLWLNRINLKGEGFMELKRYQWVGLLVGVPSFSGAWLSAFYNTPWWGVLGILLAMGGVYVANHVERRSDLR